MAVNRKKRLAVSPSLYSRLLTIALPDDKFEISTQPAGMNARRIGDQEVDAVLMSVFEYGREASRAYLVPGIAVSSMGHNDVSVLHFRDGLHTISTLAADPGSISDIVLARIVLAEEFDNRPSIVPVTGDLDEMLAKADAALLTDDRALAHASSHLNKLNLIEAWNDMTQLPFVHAVWAGIENALSVENGGDIRRWMDQRESVIARIVHETQGFPEGALEDYLDSFFFEFGDDAQAAMTEFYRYAYYHGIMTDIPDLQFYFEENPDEANASDE